MNHASVPSPIVAFATQLVAEADWGELTSITPLEGGRNNRVYRVAGMSNAGILKQYHTGSGRDRFGSEIAWYRYCQALAISQVPVLYASDAASQCALFSEVRGRKLQSGEVSEEHVRQAADFINDLNRDRDDQIIARLPLAAEACLKIDDYLNHVNGRIQRIQSIPITDDPSADLRSWVENSLIPLWNDKQAAILNHFTPQQRSQPRTPREMCVSPSDFGFHNALLNTEGSLVFIDFEYAGRDDPAKMVCDFFWQIDRPAPRSTLPILLNATGQFDDSVVERVRQLFPVMGLKWCAIVLNEFLDADRIRREFASGSLPDQANRQRQLEIAKQILTDVHNLSTDALF